MRVLVYMEAVGGSVAETGLELIVAARSLIEGQDGQVDALVLAAEASPLVAGIRGADRVLTVSHPVLAQYNPAAHAACLQAVIGETQPDLVLLSYTTAGLDLGPWLAIRLGWPLVSYCTGVTKDGGVLRARGQIYGGKLVADVEVACPAVLIINPGAYHAEEVGETPPGRTASLPAPAALDSLPVVFSKSAVPDPDAVDITRSDRLLCVGRGIGEKDNIEEARDVAGLWGAELVGSRPVVDAGWLPKERQVGKSGRKVKPRAYLALGVSGAPEHLEGMATAELIIAINQDAQAPIFDHAHFGAAVDLFEFLPALKNELEKRGA